MGRAQASQVASTMMSCGGVAEKGAALDVVRHRLGEVGRLAVEVVLPLARLRELVERREVDRAQLGESQATLAEARAAFERSRSPLPHAHVVTTTTHKSLRGPRGGMVLATEEFAPSVDRGCPLVLGGPLAHVMAAKAVALAEARTEAFRAYAQAVADKQALVQVR